MIQFDYSNGFPDNWITTSLENEYAHKLFKKHFPNAKRGMLLNCTWKFDDQFEQIKRDMSKADAILIYNFVDEYSHDLDELVNFSKLNKVVVAGHAPGDVRFQFWPLAVNKFFTDYKSNELIGELTNLYVCYNRKPHPHRVELYQQFKKHNLLDCGVFTLGSEEGKGVSYKDNDFSGDDAFPVFGTHYGVPNDLMSLGNMDVWQSSALCIVPETIYGHNSVDGFPFLTEKIFKPIVGMKPFVVLGPNGANDYLEEHGFKTFHKELGIKNNATAKEIAGCLSKLTIDDIKPLYMHVDHNYKQFKKYCKRQTKHLGLG